MRQIYVDSDASRVLTLSNGWSPSLLPAHSQARFVHSWWKTSVPRCLLVSILGKVVL